MRDYKLDITVEFQGKVCSFETYVSEENAEDAKEYARERFLAILDVVADAHLVSEEENEYQVTVCPVFEAQSCDFDVYLIAENEDEAEDIAKDMFLETMVVDVEVDEEYEDDDDEDYNDEDYNDEDYNDEDESEGKVEVANELELEKRIEMELGDLEVASYTVGASEFKGQLADGENRVRMKVTLPSQVGIATAFERNGEEIAVFKVVGNSIEEIKDAKDGLMSAIAKAKETLTTYLTELKKI